MKIKSIRRIQVEETPVYDVVNANPYNNFIVKSGNSAIVAHNCLIDEVNFKGGKSLQVEQSKVFEMYTSILGRMQSRFLVNGRCAGMIFLASSKQSEYDFLEKYIQRKKEENDRKPKNQRSFYCFDHPQWEVLPASKYPSGKYFKIAVGGLTLSDKIVEPEEETEEYLEELRKAGYTRIIEVPIELYDTAKMGLSKFMMDYAGIASTLSTKFFSYAEYEDNISKVIEPLFSQEILKIGLKDVAKINDSFYPDKIPYSVYSKKLFIHIDTSLSGDRTGISCVAVMGYRDQDRTDENGTSEIMKELIYRHVFTIAIEAPKGDQISFQKTREFIFYLKNVLHWNIAKVTTDGFQSADMRQQLTLAGINTDYVSLDRTPNGYLMFKQALLEKRINLITNEHQKLLYEEFLNVERNNMTGKIDHTIDGCFTADTKIKLVDGRDVTIKELMQEQLYRDNYVYTFNEEKQIIEPKKIKKVFQTKITSDLLRVTLDNGEIIECTPEHRFMLRDGSYKQIQDIKVGDALMTCDKEIKLKNSEEIHFEIGIPVYDLEIEDNHNFALSAGVIVHNSKDALDSLVGATYSASLSITSLDLASMDNFSILMEANKSDYIQDFSSNPVNAMFNMSKTASTASRPVNELSIDEQEQQSRQQEQEILKELRSHLDDKDNRQVSNKQLLDMYGNQFEDDDMIIF